MTPEQVCAVLGMAPGTFWHLVLTGQLPVIGGREAIRVSEPALEEYIAARLPAVAS